MTQQTTDRTLEVKKRIAALEAEIQRREAIEDGYLFLDVNEPLTPTELEHFQLPQPNKEQKHDN